MTDEEVLQLLQLLKKANLMLDNVYLKEAHSIILDEFKKQLEI